MTELGCKKCCEGNQVKFSRREETTQCLVNDGLFGISGVDLLHMGPGWEVWEKQPLER